MKNFIETNWHKLVLAFYALILPTISFADGGNSGCTTPGMLCNPIPNVTSIPGLINIILTGLLQLGIPVVALAIIYSGFLFVAARGNSEKLSKAKDTLLYTIIGAAILLGSWAIATMISNTVGALS